MSIFVRRNKVCEFMSSARKELTGTDRVLLLHPVSSNWVPPGKYAPTPRQKQLGQVPPLPSPCNPPSPQKNHLLDDVYYHVGLFVDIDVTSDPWLPNMVIGMRLMDAMRSVDFIIWTLAQCLRITVSRSSLAYFRNLEDIFLHIAHWKL